MSIASIDMRPNEVEQASKRTCIRTYIGTQLPKRLVRNAASLNPGICTVLITTMAARSVVLVVVVDLRMVIAAVVGS